MFNYCPKGFKRTVTMDKRLCNTRTMEVENKVKLNFINLPSFLNFNSRRMMILRTSCFRPKP